MQGLIEIDTVQVRELGGSLYSLVPKILREQNDLVPGDRVVFLRNSDMAENECVIRIEKQTPKNGSEHPAR